jgi:hypothetical protein
VIYDLETSASIVRVEGSRRLGSSWRLSLEAWAFVDFHESDRFSSFRDDDFVRIEAAYLLNCLSHSIWRASGCVSACFILLIVSPSTIM